MTTFREGLELVANRAVFEDSVSFDRRWGQLLRATGFVSRLLETGRASQTLVPLRDLSLLRGGVVTRANAYFIVRELPFEGVPPRFHLTKKDYERFAVVMDGAETPHKIERRFLRPLVKGPDSLLTPMRIEGTDQRLFVVDESPAALKTQHANGALDYLRRGETFAYKVSPDSLKGGVPAKRANVKYRKPYWFSLSVPEARKCRIIVPEHVDTRYPATLIGPRHASVVVIDKLYTIEPHDMKRALLLLASLNSVLTWYQLELRGRTQLGQGVLELKKPDWEGILILNPAQTESSTIRSLLTRFKPLQDKHETDALSALADPERAAFDIAYLSAIGIPAADEARSEVERELRAAIGERHERRESVRSEREQGVKGRRVSANIDAYAARIAAVIHSYPDPRTLVSNGTPTTVIPITGPVDGTVTVGTDLFSLGQVLVDGERVADTSSDSSARFVRAVLLHDPSMNEVRVPDEPQVTVIIDRWEEECRAWREQFAQRTASILESITDERVRKAARLRALALLHAE